MRGIFDTTQKDLLEMLVPLKECNLDFERNIRDLEKAKRISDVFLVCKDGKNVVGTVRAIFDGYYCMLFDLAVKPGFRNCGVGELLMREAEKRLRKEGATYVFLNSSDGAVKFYKKIGYTKPKINPMIKNFEKNVKI